MRAILTVHASLQILTRLRSPVNGVCPRRALSAALGGSKGFSRCTEKATGRRMQQSKLEPDTLLISDRQQEFFSERFDYIITNAPANDAPNIFKMIERQLHKSEPVSQMQI